MKHWDPHKILHLPWYAAMQPAFQPLAEHAAWPSHADYQSLLQQRPQSIQSANGKVLRVVAQSSEKTSDWQQAYEARLYLHGELQTRLESWHDCFNLLTWATFPAAKAALNAAQFALLAAQAEAPSAPGRRSPKQDALTQLDESGVLILCAEPALSQLLLAFQWKPLFWEKRAQVTVQMRCFLFGHGLMERALMPYPGLTGKGVVLSVAAELLQQPLALQLAEADRRLAQVLKDAGCLMRPRDLAPIPILGFPGFTPDSACAEYYDDQRYFRPGRTLKP